MLTRRTRCALVQRIADYAFSPLGRFIATCQSSIPSRHWAELVTGDGRMGGCRAVEGRSRVSSDGSHLFWQHCETSGPTLYPLGFPRGEREGFLLCMVCGYVEADCESRLRGKFYWLIGVSWLNKTERVLIGYRIKRINEVISRSMSECGATCSEYLILFCFSRRSWCQLGMVSTKPTIKNL